MGFVEFITAFGLGAIVTTMIQIWYSNKSEIAKRDFQEKKEAYVGYLDSIVKNETEGTEESARYSGHWINRIELVGNEQVIQSCMRMMETNPINGEVHPDRPQVLQSLKRKMREDLGVGRRYY